MYLRAQCNSCVFTARGPNAVKRASEHSSAYEHSVRLVRDTVDYSTNDEATSTNDTDGA